MRLELLRYQAVALSRKKKKERTVRTFVYTTSVNSDNHTYKERLCAKTRFNTVIL